MEANQLERRRWNDPLWTRSWPKRERLTDSVTPVLMEALSLRPGERVLDIGCGGGKAALRAADAVGDTGLVVGADISAPLTELATRRSVDAGATNASFRVADVQTEPLGGGPFDVAMSQFGVMFFDEPERAFANVRSHLAVAGRIGFACWQAADENPWFIGGALAGMVAPPPAPEPGKSPVGPFALADGDRVRAILEGAGFEDVSVTRHRLSVDATEETVVDRAQLAFSGVAEDRMAEALATVDRHMARFRQPSGLSRFPLAFQVVTAVTAEG